MPAQKNCDQGFRCLGSLCPSILATILLVPYRVMSIPMLADLLIL